MKRLIHEGFEITHTKFYIISLTLRLKNRETERDNEVSNPWPRGTVRGCPPARIFKKTLNVPYG